MRARLPFLTRGLALPLALAVTPWCACSSSGTPAGTPDAAGATLPPTDPAALMTTLTDLAAFGEKHVGSPAGAQAGAYVKQRFTDAGLTNVHLETFGVPRYDVQSSSLALTVDGTPMAPQPGHDVFEASGIGHAEGDLVWCGGAQPVDVANLDLTGKVAVVRRVISYHRSNQYRNVTAKGAVAMLYLSVASDNLRQVGSVRHGWEAMGTIPAITIGADDGKTITDALMGGKTVHAVIDVAATTTPATGANVVGTVPGTDPAGHQILVGAHYDTWFTGSSDNGGGVAALVALADRRVKKAKLHPPRYTLVFVGYDGEEPALFGGYDYLHKHRVAQVDPILAALNFEIPSANGATFFGLAYANFAVLDMALRSANLNNLYLVYVMLNVVPSVLGGNIPTDIQGIYRSGVPTLSTAADSPYYHTTADTPDKVDTTFLATAVDEFDLALDFLDAADASAFGGADPKLWKAQVTLAPRQAGQPLVVSATITDATGAPQANAPVEAAVLHDDFFLGGDQITVTDAQGKITFTFPADQVEAGTANRFVHVTAGPDYPLVEQVTAIAP